MISKYPLHGWIGLTLLITFWWVNWGMTGLRSHWAFFPLWLGYILVVDGFAVLTGRPSLLHKFRSFIWLFVLSAPVWWLFEVINWRVDYWEYLPIGAFTPLEFYFWSTVCFSTVIPAIFVTANFLSGFNWFQKHHFTLRAGKTPTGRAAYFTAGCAMLLFVIIWPEYGMAFLWIALFFILDPINYRLRNQSILRMTSNGDWRAVWILFSASLICGFFWEMWNYYAWPKWIYTFPFLDGNHIFEMPLAGYLGYLPFSLELFALVAFMSPLFKISFPEFIDDANPQIDIRANREIS